MNEDKEYEVTIKARVVGHSIGNADWRALNGCQRPLRKAEVVAIKEVEDDSNDSH